MAFAAPRTASRPRSTLLKLAAAAAILLLALWLWHRRTPAYITPPLAQTRAEQMLAAFIQRSGEPPSHFAAMTRIEYPEGWEYSWAYVPCPDVARLSVFIRRTGSGHYGEMPDCHPVRGFTALPQAV